MEIALSKKTILYLLVLFWLVFSVVYIGRGIWIDFEYKKIVSAYEQGRVDTINALVFEAEKCEPVPITGTRGEVVIIGTHCLEEIE